MAFSNRLLTKSYNTGTDLSAKQYYIAALSGADQVAVCGDGAAAIGVLTEDVADGSSTVARVTVCHLGITQVIAGGTIAAGTPVSSNATGQAVTGTTSGDYVVGMALEDAVANDIFPILLTLGGQEN